jgi:uncharacterized protein
MDLEEINNSRPVEFGLKAHQIEMIKNTFSQFPEIEEVWIYGSRARGDFGRASDIDLCIIKPTIDHSTYLKVFSELDELFIPFKFDLTVFDKLTNDKLKESIQKEGVVFKIKN